MIPLVLAVLLAAPPVDCEAAVRRLPTPVRGIVVPLHSRDRTFSYRPQVREVREAGANAVSIMPTWDVHDVRSPAVGEGAASAAQLEEALDAARAEGLAILVAPVLRLETMAPGDWRGVLAPPDWDAWFASYRRRLLALAGTAERFEVEALVVGSELCSSENHEGQWRRLIADVRQEFHGSLTYQANWDHREAPRFLDALDLAGSNGYFELAPSLRHPSVSTLVSAWRPFKDALLAWADGQGQSLLLTEVGYPSVPGGAARPWDYAQGSAVDLEVQARAYEALFRVWAREPRAAGLFVYEWWGEGGPEDTGYTPRGKPALEVLRRWFREGSR